MDKFSYFPNSKYILWTYYNRTKEQKKEMLDIINAAIKDPSFAKEIEKLKRDDDIGFNMLWYAVFRTVGVFL